MSAICGIIHFDGKPVEKSDLETMVESSPNRGPDGTRYYLDGNAGFAHLAFHVTPESVHERQPLVSEDGRLVLVADVRLDNREELASKLGVSLQPVRGRRAGDHLFSSIDKKSLENRPHSGLLQVSDDWLLLAAWRRWGEGCLEHLLGDFVFALWEREKRELFLARDQLGGHSLSYTWTGQTLVFASETAAILDLPAIQSGVNEDSVLKTLASIGLNADQTYFNSINYLSPAHCMKITSNDKKTWRYWDIDPDRQISYRCDEEYTDHFLELLNQAVACRLRSVAPCAISLSGGYDSTLLAAIAAQQLSDSGQPLKSYSYVFDRLSQCDEREYIQPVVQQYGIDATCLVSDDLWTFSGLAERRVPLDFLWTNCYSQLPESVAQAAGQAGCRVLLSGAFGDALFSEPSLFAADLLRQGKLGKLYQILRQFPEDTDWRGDIIQRGLRPLSPRWLRRLNRRVNPLDCQSMAPGLSDSRLKQLQDLIDQQDHQHSPGRFPPGRRSRYMRIFDSSWAQGFAATRNQPYNRCGLERLNPYFDRRLVEFVMALPTEQLSHPGRPRKLQNDAMRRLLPDKVSQRRGKTGFEPLLRLGLLKKEKGIVMQLLDDPLVVKQGWMNVDWLETQSRNTDITGNEEWFFVMSLHLELWLRAIRLPIEGRAKWSSPGHWN